MAQDNGASAEADRAATPSGPGPSVSGTAGIPCAFTPGPWTASVESKPYAPSLHWYVVLDTEENGLGEFYGDDHKTNVANLRVAAAAPELLDALEKAAPFVGWAATRDQIVAGVHADELCDVIDAIIAKARGQ